MKLLDDSQISLVSGGKPKIFNVISSTVIGGVVGFFVGGPPGMIAGAITGAGGGLVKEGAYGIAEITHPHLFQNEQG